MGLEEPAGSACDPTLPPVAVIMPILNETRHLRAAVAAVQAQDYRGPMEIVLALGPSTDDTDVIAKELAAADPRISTVNNPTGATPCGLNAAIAASTHQIVVRVDGHAILPPDYVRIAVEVLAESGADNVGGIMAAEGVTPFEQAVARAMRSRLGIGGSRFHVGGEAGPADTVYLGVFRRAILEQVGGFDESLRRAQDWELNHRIREAGGTVWFTPRMQVTYRPRPDLPALAKQFFRTGQWRRGVIRRMPRTANARYLAPPAVVLAVLGGTVLGLAGKRIGWLAPGGYLAVVLAGSAANAKDLDTGAAVRLPVVLATMHMAWGAGFLLSPTDLISEPDS
ncbi:MAG TPA: glycosyltransferase family 2 protein [Sporichthyaceae bacterium]|nr:glycosyltransferase family 2 protein [Sporichthyaceae bacterium]